MAAATRRCRPAAEERGSAEVRRPPKRAGHGVVPCAALVLLMLLAGCHKKAPVSRGSSQPPPPLRPPPASRSTAARHLPQPVPRMEPGTRNMPVPDDNEVPTATVLTGMASWYAPSGRRSANGDVYDGNSLTAAHRTLPLGTVLRVTNLSTGQTTDVRVTDRGPFVHGRVLDLSTAAAKAIGVYRMGVARVTMEVVETRPDVSPIGKWCVQIGAFLDPGNADRLRADLLRQYSTSAKVIEFAGATGMWVRINPLQSDRAHATAIAHSIRVAEPDAEAWLVRLD